MTMIPRKFSKGDKVSYSGYEGKVLAVFKNPTPTKESHWLYVVEFKDTFIVTSETPSYVGQRIVIAEDYLS